MTRFQGMLMACATLLLVGCANGTRSAFSDLLPSGTGSSAAPPSGRQGTLYLGIVDGLIKQRRPSAALAFLDGYCRSGEDLSPRYWLLRGKALAGVHRNAEAAFAFAKLEETALAAQGWNGLGRIAADEGNWRAADENFHKAVDGDPANSDFLNNLAFAELHLAKADSAAAWLEQAHELAPDSQRILTNLIIALTVKGDTARADSIISGIDEGNHREAVRALVKNGVATLSKQGQS